MQTVLFYLRLGIGSYSNSTKKVNYSSSGRVHVVKAGFMIIGIFDVYDKSSVLSTG